METGARNSEPNQALHRNPRVARLPEMFNVDLGMRAASKAPPRVVDRRLGRWYQRQ